MTLSGKIESSLKWNWFQAISRKCSSSRFDFKTEFTTDANELSPLPCTYERFTSNSFNWSMSIEHTFAFFICVKKFHFLRWAQRRTHGEIRRRVSHTKFIFRKSFLLLKNCQSPSPSTVSSSVLTFHVNGVGCYEMISFDWFDGRMNDKIQSIQMHKTSSHIWLFDTRHGTSQSKTQTTE